MLSLKLVKMIGFSDIFNFAEEFGVSWNEANDLFFGENLEYGNITECHLEGISEFTEDDGVGYTLEALEVIYQGLDDDWDKARLILESYFYLKGITGTVYVDAK